MFLLLGALPLSAITITRTSSPVFHIDTKVAPSLQAMYVAYQIRNDTGSTYPDLWVTIGDFTGGSVSLGPFEDGVVHLGPLAPGQVKAAYFHVQAGFETAAAQGHTIRVHPTRPPAGTLASGSFTMTVEETIQANANQVETVVAGPNPPQVGGLVTVTVQGRSGTIGADHILAFNPAAYLSWRSDAYELVLSTLVLTGGNTGNHTDTLYLVVPSSSSTDYTATYTYRTVATTTTATPVSPISFISSGQQLKHTRVNNYVQFDPIQPANNLLTLGKTVSPAQALAGANVTFSLILTNAGTVPTIVEDLMDTLPTLPASLTYVPGSSRYQGAVIPDPGVSGEILTWIGTFNIPAGGIATLSFQATLPSLGGSYTNRAISHIGPSQIDSTRDLLDDAPAVAVVQAGLLSVSGRVFLDSGVGGGTAHDGLLNGTETGIDGVSLQLTDPTGATIYGTATTDATGAYIIQSPVLLADGTALQLRETNPANHLSASANMGNSGGSYDRDADILSFTYHPGVTWTNLHFGDVPLSQFVANGQQPGVPGGFVTYAHVFTAGSAGELDLVITNTPSPALPGWTQVIHVDANCDGQLDASDPPWNGPVPLAAGDRLCLLVRESIPLAAPLNATDTVQLTAVFDHTGANPALVTELTVIDVTTVGGPGSLGLTLVKSADKAEARPGETLTYTLTYANTSAEPLANMSLHDITPAYTTFLGATNGPLGSDLTGVVATTPAVGASGVLQWTFQGTLAPGQGGYVRFQVVIEQ